MNRFYRESEFWTIAFDAETARLRDSRGLLLLSELLRQSGRELHVVHRGVLSLFPRLTLRRCAEWCSPLDRFLFAYANGGLKRGPKPPPLAPLVCPDE